MKIEIEASEVGQVASAIRSAANAIKLSKVNKDSQSTVKGNSPAGEAIQKLEDVASKMKKAGNSYADALESVANAMLKVDGGIAGMMKGINQ